jgi:uncharacterized membrane protein
VTTQRGPAAGVHQSASAPELATVETDARPTPSRRHRLLSAARGILHDWLPFRDLPPAPTGRGARIARIAVAALVVMFVIYYSAYLFAMQDAYLTHGEDMGIMMQALWNTTHGAVLHQTVCNIVSDTNCLGDVSRLAIHFEPIMFPIALLYWAFPSAKTLQFLQTAIVALGAFPAYWIASRRLGNVAVGVLFAFLYLLHASLDSAVTFDFHAVTLAAPFLMFALYFLLTRNTVGLFSFCVLAMSTKEEVALSVALIGLCAIAFQSRWRVGAGLLAMAVAWVVMEVAIMHAASPIGHAPTIGRYAQFGTSPAQIVIYVLTHPALILRNYVFDHSRILYLRALVAPLGYLAVLSPLVILITAPALAINMLSSDPRMYSGFLQYAAESVPIMVLASIESVAFLARVGTRLYLRLKRSVVDTSRPMHDGLPILSRLGARLRHFYSPQPVQVLALALTLVALGFCLHSQRNHNYTPLGATFTWPQTTAHTRIADQLVAMIPPNASVTAQSNLVPHVSNRRYVYMFPYQAHQAEYVLLDQTGELYPLDTMPAVYRADVASVLADPAYRIVVDRDGYLLLRRIRQ